MVIIYAYDILVIGSNKAYNTELKDKQISMFCLSNLEDLSC
jgi:hypothetical protein